MNPHHIEDASAIISPGLVVSADIVRENLLAMIAIAGTSQRLRPHCKTHKMREIVEMGITRHKCAIFAEAEMLAEAEGGDVFLADNLVGPDIARAVRFLGVCPQDRLSVAALNKQAFVVRGGRVTERWDVAARLTV